jgi:molybdopterin-guanine dinucleotide biosynthesis protein A
MIAQFDAEGFVLAGGRSSRMGAEKALVSFAGEPLITHALRILRNAGLSASIAGARAPLERFAPVVPDDEPGNESDKISGNGPLSGICAALASTSAHWAVFLPVDMPLLPSSLVTLLLHEAVEGGAVAVVPEVNGFTETFPAVVDRALLPALRTELDAGRAGCLSALKTAAASVDGRVRVVSVDDAVRDGRLAHPDALDLSLWLLNINRPEDLARAEACRC